MTATLLANELSTLIADAKRKNGDLRTAAESSLAELKALPATSEQQLASEDLSRRHAFIDPFLKACQTGNAKFSLSGVTCLQRLIISRGLPTSRLKDALDAFNACVGMGIDIQLKILQGLPSLLQNYADELRGELLASAIQVCASLQSTKTQTISGVAAATLQQLVTAVFERAKTEGVDGTDAASIASVPGDNGPVALRPAAYDAYRLFRELVMNADGRTTRFVDLSSLSVEFTLELVWSLVDANQQLFEAHAELQSTVRSSLLPTAIRSLSERLSFPFTLRSVRMLNLILNRSLLTYQDDCEVVLDLMTDIVETDSTQPWKRALVLEAIRNMFSTEDVVIDAYIAYDRAEKGKPVIQDLLAAFVRLSSEKPAAIGLGQYSTVPTGSTSQRSSLPDQAALDTAGDMTGVMAPATDVYEGAGFGISPLWSVPRVACLDQMDKSEPPIIPDTYIYTLVLECLNGLSDSLAKVVLPLTVQRDKKVGANGDGTEKPLIGRTSRSRSFRGRSMPLNPLADDSSATHRVRAVGALVEDCWPAVLATSSTFLNAALDEQYYRALIKSYQRFAQVAGLLRLSTPRDALMTSLGKAAVPPQVLSAAIAESVKSPSIDGSRTFSSARSFLGGDSLTSPASSDPRISFERSRTTLTIRNLLCLRALLNLAIALGPTLNAAISVVVDVLRQADLILSTTTPQQWQRDSQKVPAKGTDSPVGLQAFTAEVVAVEAAASRLLESTVDFPNNSFLTVLRAFCGQATKDRGENLSTPESHSTSPSTTPIFGKRSLSGLPGISTMAELQERDYRFVIPKLGSLAQLNISRFTMYDPDESGWTILTETFSDIASGSSHPPTARRAATDVLCKLSSAVILDVSGGDDRLQASVQERSFAVLWSVIDRIYAEDGELTSADTDVQCSILDAVRGILEQSGDSIAAGWPIIISVMASAFEHADSVNDHSGKDLKAAHDGKDMRTNIDWSTVSHDLISVDVGRSAFAVTQLVCSDFLVSLPGPAISSLVELLYRFISQTDDLNVALTSVTMAWTVAETLFEVSAIEELDLLDLDASDLEDLSASVVAASRDSKAAQWMFLLIRLRDTIDQPTTNEVRSAAFHTIWNAFKTHGSDLTASTWDLCLRAIMFRIETVDAAKYIQGEDGHADAELRKQALSRNGEMSRTIISGTAEIMAQHIGHIERAAKLPGLWELFLSKLEAYMDIGFEKAAYSALARVLSQINGKSVVWAAPAYRTLSLWLNRLPEGERDVSDKLDNQATYIAYVETVTEIYRLTKENLGTSQLRKIIDNLYLCVSQATGQGYGGDVNVMSPLQTKVLNLLRAIRPSTQMIASSLITVAAQLCLLHHAARAAEMSKGPSSIALASHSIDWLHALLHSALQGELLGNGSLITGLQSLRRIIEDKYIVPAECKGVALWRNATDTAVSLSRQVLELDDGGGVTEAEYVGIARGIVNAQGLQLTHDRLKIHDDEVANIESFHALKRNLVPSLLNPGLPDSIRLEYCRALFDASIVHPCEPNEIPGPGESPLANLGMVRRGRARRVAPSSRERMSYACFSELIQLASKSDDSVQQKLARAAGPLLVLRLSIPIRSYISDQPLRGRRPQPLSELEELLFCFEEIKRLELDSEALSADPSGAGRVGEKAHLHFLYPLLVKAVAEAGDRWSGAEEVFKPLQALLESITPVP